MFGGSTFITIAAGTRIRSARRSTVSWHLVTISDGTCRAVDGMFIPPGMNAPSSTLIRFARNFQNLDEPRMKLDLHYYEGRSYRPCGAHHSRRLRVLHDISDCSQTGNRRRCSLS